MKFTFNLLAAPWVPCIRMDGTPVELGLQEALTRAHELRELHGESPLVTAALYRLLLAVLHRVFGPADSREWAVLWEDHRWDGARLGAYLRHWRHRFDLFDPQHPFYQAPDPRVKPKSVTSLAYEVASGNNPTLFDHHMDLEGISLAPAEAARMLVAVQAFGLAGLSGLAQKFTDAPCARGIVFLVEGDSLFETLSLNLLPYTTDSPIQRQRDDRPAWEMDDPFSPHRSRPSGYLDYLTWQNRRVLLLPEGTRSALAVRQMTFAPGLRLADGILNPMTNYRPHEKRGFIPLTFTEQRALWRDSAALFRLRDEKNKPPHVFNWLANLSEDGHLSVAQTRRYVALGMSKKQAKVNFYQSERMPLPLVYLTDESLRGALATALETAERTARKLSAAAWTLATLILSPEADARSGRRPLRQDVVNLTNRWAIDRYYWSRLEIPFREMMEALPKTREQTPQFWRRHLVTAAWESFDRVTRELEGNVRGLKATVKARGHLAAGLAQVFPPLDDS